MLLSSVSDGLVICLAAHKMTWFNSSSACQEPVEYYLTCPLHIEESRLGIYRPHAVLLFVIDLDMHLTCVLGHGLL